MNRLFKPMSKPVQLRARYLCLSDIPALVDLENKKWSNDQAATAELLHHRITLLPQLCLGVFCPQTGQAMASLFMAPFDEQRLKFPMKWDGCADLKRMAKEKTQALFGLSFSSIHPEAGNALFRFFWPKAIKAGWQRIYLGSPVPGFSKAREMVPSLDIEQYL